MDGTSMLAKYFDEEGVKPGFDKEFVSIFDGWLGMERLHLLDEVTEADWARFNALVALIGARYALHEAYPWRGTCRAVADIDAVMDTWAVSMSKSGDNFTHFIIPELDCILAEDWDFTYIIWHRGNGAVEALAPLVEAAGLYHFHN